MPADNPTAPRRALSALLGPNDTSPRRVPLPWAGLLLLAALGTLLGTSLTLLDLDRTRATNGGLIHTGPEGPAAELMARDFPDEPQFATGEHDGPMVYAIAKDAWHLDTVAESLDRPRYRLQHPLLGWLAWVLDPTGDGGPRLLWSLFAIGVLAMWGAGVATGALSATLGGPTWVAAIVPILPGATVSLRITVADTLALALVLAAVTASLRGRTVLAALLGTGSVLAKESMALTLVARAVRQRDLRGLALVAVPAVVAGAWMVVLAITVETSGQEVIEFGLPFAGLGEAITEIWLEGDSPYALISAAAAAALTVAALVRRGWAHPLAPAVVVNAAFAVMLTTTVLGLERNGTRMTMPLLVLALVMLVAPGAEPRTATPPPLVTAATGRGTDRG